MFDILAPWKACCTKQLDSLHLRQSKCPVLLNNIGCAWPFRRNPCLATWLTVRCSTGIDTCQGFYHKLILDVRTACPSLSQRSHGTRVRLSRAKAPPAKKGGWIWGQKCHKLWSGLQHFSADPMRCFKIPVLDWTHLITSLNRSCHRSIVSSLSLAWMCSHGKVTWYQGEPVQILCVGLCCYYDVQKTV